MPLLVVHGIGHRVEPQLHREFAPYRVQGEWYALPDDEVAALVKTYGRLNVVNERRRRPWLDRMYRLSRKNVRD